MKELSSEKNAKYQKIYKKNLKKYKKTIDFTFQRCYYHIQLFEREKQIKKYILYVKK